MMPSLLAHLRRMTGRLGFRSRAILALASSLVLFSIITAGITPMLANRIMAFRETNDGAKIASIFARQNTLTLLYKSSTNAKETVSNTMSFPDITFVDVRDETHVSILQSGQNHDHWDPKDFLQNSRIKETVLAYETADNWHFLSPVTTNVLDTGFAISPVKNEYLGYVHVIRSKASLERLQQTLLSYIVALNTFALIVGSLLLWWLTSLLVYPVRALAETMARARSNSVPIRAEESGAPEIANMAHEFNDLMRRLEEHSQLLEFKVQARTSELVQSDQRKSEFLAMISHELRTPLQSLVSYAEQALHSAERAGDHIAAGDLHVVLDEADHVATLIDNLIDLAKIEAGHMDIKWSSVDLRALGEEVERIIKPIANKQNNSFQLVNECISIFWYSDHRKLLQILINLLGNACKFTKDGTIMFRIACEGGMLILSVSDTGKGIELADQKIIFKAFKQARFDGHPGGAGLGLSITHRLCALLGGTISVKSEPGKGATFTVRLPMAKPSPQEIISS